MTPKIMPPLLPPSDPRWLEHIRTSPDATIFHHPAWMELLSQCYGYAADILVVWDGKGAIRAGLPLMKVSSPLTGRRWISLPFSDYCNPLCRDASAAEELTGEMVELHRATRVDWTEVRWELPAHPAMHRASEFVLHRLKLESDPCQVSSRFKRTHLQNIRAAQERSVTVEVGNELKHMRLFYDLQVETRKRHGVTVQPWRYFELVWRNLVKKDMGFVLLARKDGEAIAGMVYLAWGGSLTAKYAASREDRFNLRPNNLLFWEGIRWGCQHGFAVFDMGRTELQNTGLRSFKSRWGAEEQPLSYSVLSSKPYHPHEETLSRLQRSLIQRSPLWVCRLSGDLLYRHFG